jgi:hypothetical protein
MDYGKTFFSLVDVVSVYGDKDTSICGVYTQKIYKKSQKNINKNTKLKVRDTQVFFIFFIFVNIFNFVELLKFIYTIFEQYRELFLY